MSINSLIFIAVGLSMDAFAVSLTSSMAVEKLRLNYALKLALLFGLFQMAMPIIGWLAGIGFANKIAIIDQYVSFVLLAGIGIKMIVETVKESRKSEKIVKEELGLKIILVLAVATSIDALAVGITFACTGVNKFSTLLFYCGIIGIITFVICFIGCYAGTRFGKLLKNKAGIFGGAVLIAIGTKMLIEGFI